jgi:hypothetical protein
MLNLKDPTFDATCFTSNGMVTGDGRLVMGAGIAKLFRDTFPGIDRLFGGLVKEHGNRCFMVTIEGVNIVNFPTKHDWRDDSDLALIETSCRQLMELVHAHDLKKVRLPRPGCSLGRLTWEVVGPTIARVLDGRVVVAV